jgi:hypothetical protein
MVSCARYCRCVLFWLAVVGVTTPPVLAQQPLRPGTLRFVVRDATNLPVAGATVIVTPAGGAALTAVANDRGEAIFDRMTPGDYGARIESPGFKPVDVKDLRVRAGGQTTRTVDLEIAGLLEEIDVTPPEDDQQLLGAFTDVLTAEQIAALPDDPEELAEVLQQLAGADAELRINGFTGARLPPGAQIQDVRIRYDSASGNSSGGGPRIEVRTRPGSGRWQNTFNVNLRDDALNARNAFSGERPSGQTRQYSWTATGPLIKNRTGISLSFDRSDSLDQATIRAARPDGLFSALVSQPNKRTGFEMEVEHALTKTQELRIDINAQQGSGRNQGLSEFDLPERAFSRTSSDGEIRIGHRSTIRRQSVNNLRFQYQWQSSDAQSESDATTIRVLDAFTTGGAQVHGGRRSNQFELEDELEFTWRKTHQISAGASAIGTYSLVDERRNENGTFTFASLEMFGAGIPTTFTQRLISARSEYSLLRSGWFIQDNYRVSKSVMLNFALRHDLQTRLSDWVNFSPRVSGSWTLPGRKTTLRASFGMFPQFFEGGTLEQTLFVNGLQQRDIVISSPGYPDPLAGGVPADARPPSIVRAHRGIFMPHTRRIGVGLDRTLAKWARLRASYSHGVGRHQFRSRDVNAPVDGVRPDPSVRTITELESAARSSNKGLEVNLTLNHQPRRFTANIGYTLGQVLNEADGPLSLPPNSSDLSQEWGPARQDVRHRLNVGMNTDVRAGFRANLQLRAQSAAPYNVTTGLDLNGDGLTNERPDGVRRNSARGEPTAGFDMGLTWGRSIGERTAVDGEQRGGNRQGGANRQGGGNNNNSLFRFEIFLRASNVLNLVMPQNFSGVQTSPFFGRPTSAAAARRIMIGTRAYF